MNKKGQVQAILTVLVIVVVIGVLLFQFSDLINELRVDTLQNIQDTNPNGQPLERIILTGLMPLIWLIYVIFSAVALVVSVRGSQGVL